MDQCIKFFDLFSGIGGFRLGLQNASPLFKCVGACEINDIARRTYFNHFGDWPEADATDIKGWLLPDFDLLCAGFPCQPFSLAGRRLGFKESRGTIFYEIARLAKEKRPRYLLLENVKGLLYHDNNRTIIQIITTLEELGYDVQWEVINGARFLPQSRERIFIVGSLGDQPRPKVFPLSEGQGILNPQNQRQQREGQGVRGEVTSTIDARYGALRNAGETYIVADRTRTKQGLGRNLEAPKKRTNALTSVPKDNLVIKQLNDAEHSTARVYDPSGIARTLKANSGGTGTKTGLYFVGHSKGNIKKRYQKRSTTWTLTGEAGDMALEVGDNIRQLTPLECERLQGFPDNWTAGVSDTQRYKMLGNAVMVPVIKKIGEALINAL